MNKRNILVLLLLTVGVFTGLMIYGDVPKLAQSVSSFPAELWLAALGLALANYVARLIRWLVYMKVLGIEAPNKVKVLVFFAGFSMTLSPGRVGELAKSYLLYKKADIPVAVSAPAVIMERLVDLMSLLLLGLWGLIFIPYGWAVIGLVLLALAIFIFLLSLDGTAVLERLPLLKKWSPYYATSRDAFRTLFSLKIMTLSLALGALAWVAEGYAFWIVLKGLGSEMPIFVAVSIYAASSLLGAVTMLPGGLVSTEGAMLALLQRTGIGTTVASAATLIIRVSTLWFALLIGALSLLLIKFIDTKKEAEASTRVSASDVPAADYVTGSGD
ncbi:MAG: flippase-like domain-containing protein [Chloroflexi bacterium]|nr:flippase-like domain-containing protein [Chloroflexota bacterium]